MYKNTIKSINIASLELVTLCLPKLTQLSLQATYN